MLLNEFNKLPTAKKYLNLEDAGSMVLIKNLRTYLINNL